MSNEITQMAGQFEGLERDVKRESARLQQSRRNVQQERVELLQVIFREIFSDEEAFRRYRSGSINYHKRTEDKDTLELVNHNRSLEVGDCSHGYQEGKTYQALTFGSPRKTRGNWYSSNANFLILRNKEKGNVALHWYYSNGDCEYGKSFEIEEGITAKLDWIENREKDDPLPNLKVGVS